MDLQAQSILISNFLFFGIHLHQLSLRVRKSNQSLNLADLSAEA